MKILHFFKTYYPESVGGVVQVINQICLKTAELGIESTVLSLAKNPHASSFLYNQHRVHQSKLTIEIASAGFSLSAVSDFSRLARCADVVHYHFPWPFADIAHFLARHKRPCVVTYHSDIVRQKTLLKAYRPLKHLFLNSVDQIVATSPNYMQSSSVLQHFAKKVSIIPLGLDKASYPVPDTERINHWRNRLGPRFFLFVGVIRYYKGLHTLLDSLKVDDFPVAILGTGPLEKELRAYSDKLKLRNVHFLGSLSDADKVALLQLCYGFVFPSHLRSEAFGLSLLEAAMFGKPMISAEIGTGTSYVNIHNETGLVVMPGDPLAFQEAMRYLWRNPDISEQMGRAAETRYWELFTADRMANSYSEIYHRLVDRGPASMNR